MPQVLNGIGTWYWGRTNIRTRRGVCQFCKRSADLSSFDTTKFFVVLFVPIVPLGQKRIINQCSACKRHLMLSLKKFNALRDREVGEAVQDYLAVPADPARAERVIGKCVGHEAQEPFMEVAGQIERAQARNSAMQAQLGGAYAFFGFPDEAEAAYVRSYNLSPDPEVADMLGLFYLRQARPDEAAPLLQPILAEQRLDKIGLIYLLAEAYQAAGRHDDALSLLQQTVAAFPALESNPEFNKYRKASLKNRGSGKAIKSANLTPVQSRSSEHRPLAVMLPRLIAPALALIALCIYVGIAYAEGHSRKVWLVNGLDRQYAVDVSGRHVLLPPHVAVPVQIAEGDIAITSLDSTVPLPKQTCTIVTPLFSRPLDSRMFVINPDRAAVVYDQETIYSTNATRSGGDVAPHHMYVGELLYSFSGIDYPFEEFPRSIQMSDASARVHKKKVAVWGQGTVLDRLGIIGQEIGTPAVGTYARNVAIADPSQDQLVMIASALLPPDQALAFLRPRLDSKPIQIDVHRSYQELMQRTRPNSDLQKEYRARLEKNPDDSTLIYLLGRVTTDRNGAARLFQKSTQGPAPCAYGYFAMAYDAMAGGQFQKALDLSRQALRLSPDNVAFASTEVEALKALRKYDDLLALDRQQQSAHPLDGSAVIDEARLLVLQNHPDQAHELIAAFASRNEAAGNSDGLRQFQLHADAQIHYAQGNLQSFTVTLDSLPDDPDSAFAAAITSGRLDDAAAALDRKKAATAEDHLLMSAVAHEAKRADLEEPNLKQAANIYRQAGREERRVAAWLGSAQNADADAVCSVLLLPQQKRLVLLAMGLRDSAHRAQYFKAAAPFNFDRTFPYWTIKKILDTEAVSR
jgi:tetratricopeptide (TPR) repeat protein